MSEMAAPIRPRPSSAVALAAFAAIVLVVALVGGAFAGGAASTYAGLDRPAWAPPAWLFGPAWTVLYVLIAVAGWLAWRAGGLVAQRPAFAAYAAQLVLNTAWTPLFFGLGAYGLALLDIALLWLTILTAVVLFWSTSRLAALLLVPYLAWVGYAAALNAAVR